MDLDLSRFRDVFFDEAVEHHQALEAGLLKLEAVGGDRATLDAVFRAAHSIKGSSGTFDLPAITRYTHALENLLDGMRRNVVEVTPALIALLLRATDVLRDLIASSRAGDALPQVESSLSELDAACGIMGSGKSSADPGAARELATSACPDAVRSVRLSIVPRPLLLSRGSDPLLLLRELARISSGIDVRADLSALPPLSQLDAETCSTSWTVTLRSDASLEQLRDVFVFVEDDCDVGIEVRPESAAVVPEPDDDAGPSGTPVSEAVWADTPAGDSATVGATDRSRRATDSGSLRVPVGKVDHLIDLVGELVIAQSMVNQVMQSFAPERLPMLREAVSVMERSMRELQEQVMSVRMVTVGTVFSRFPRLVRDLAAATGKQVALEVTGEETELDKGLVERIGDPLMHLIRNCVDHGLETPEERRLAGKPAQGVIRMGALHEGGSVVIEVSDDGRGLDLQRIRDKGVALGLLPVGAAPAEAELRDLIFQPGFSTASGVTDISGRGVGMDVVKRNVEELGGSVQIESVPASGTCFRIRLPLTLAILDGLLMAVGSQTFILPLLAVVESIQLAPGELRSVQGQGELALVRGEPLPLLRLANLLGIRDAQQDAMRGIVVILEHADQRFALLVDGLVGQSQVVIKNLEANVGRLEGVMGATILGNGSVALILDTQGLVRLASRSCRTAVGELPRSASRRLLAARA